LHAIRELTAAALWLAGRGRLAGGSLDRPVRSLIRTGWSVTISGATEQVLESILLAAGPSL
jgi:hypothetical protein